MNEANALNECLDYVASQHPAHGADARRPPGAPPGPAITLSRQAGTGAHLVAEHLSACLLELPVSKGRPWTVFDQNLIERILEDHHLPKRLASFMPEDRVSAISDMVQEICGVHPSRWTLMHQAAETIIRLSELGRVILIGRGANAVTAGMSHVFHVRLIGSLEKRAAFLAKEEHLSLDEAREKASALDSGRRRYLKRYFNRNVEDCLLYHLIVNTDHLAPLDCAEVIADAALRYLKLDEKPPVSEATPNGARLSLKEWAARRRVVPRAADS